MLRRMFKHRDQSLAMERRGYRDGQCTIVGEAKSNPQPIALQGVPVMPVRTVDARCEEALTYNGMFFMVGTSSN